MEVPSKKFGNEASSASSTSKTSNKEPKKTMYYAELKTQDKPLINVWISSFMRIESENYDLVSDDIYIVLWARKFRKNPKWSAKHL